MIKKGILVFLFFTLFSSDSFCQWQRVLNVPGKPVYSVYFLNDSSNIPKTGFAGLGSEIWRTADGGKNWTQVSNSIYAPCQFSFKDSLVGWCASRGNDLYKTLDGGWTWAPMGLSIRTEGVNYNTISRRLFYVSWAATAGYSDDEGLSWTTINTYGGGGSGVDFVSGLDGIITFDNYAATKWIVTRDGGLSWTKLLPDQECWQVLAIKGTNTYFADCEGSGKILRSDDGGITWKPLTLTGLNSNLTGDIHGDLCRLYIQTYRENGGVYRSLDEGESWQFIGGPSSWFDKRFYAKGKYVYAGDTIGGVWFTMILWQFHF